MTVLFYLFSGVAILASLLVIAQRNPMHSVMLLIVSFGALSGLYVLLGAPFVAAIQIIIYAGAIMVVFLFVVMLLNAPTEDALAPDAIRSRTAWSAGAVLALILAVELVVAFGSIGNGGRIGPNGGAGASVRELGGLLFTEYAVAVQATAVLTLVAMIGAIVLAGRRQ